MERFLEGGLVLRPVEKGDIADCHAFNHPPPASVEDYEWMYFDMPFRGERPAGWVIAEPSGAIGAKLFLMYYPMRVLGRERMCCNISDLFVHARHRGRSYGTLIYRTHWETFTEGLSGGTSFNPQSMALWKKAGGDHVPGGAQRFQRILTARGWAAVALAATPRGRRAPVHTFPAEPRGRREGARQGTNWELARADDAELQSFLRDAEERLPITTRRSSAFLQWRYERCRKGRPEMLAVRRGSRIEGFLGMQIRHRRAALELRFAEVIDFLCRFDEPRVFPEMAEAVRDWAGARRADVIEWRGTHPILPRLARGALWRSRGGLNPIMYYSRDPSMEQLRSAFWHLVMADGDHVW